MIERITTFLLLPLYFLIFIPLSTDSQEKDLKLIQVFFSPEENCGGEILKRIEEAKHTIDAALYLFTSRPLSREIINAKDRGVKIRICLEGEKIDDRYSKDEYLKNNGISLRVRDDRGLMHNKFCIIDNKTLITGSYNWTHSADLWNDENIIILRVPEVILVYEEYFERLWNEEISEGAVYADMLKLMKKGKKEGLIKN
jgi:phosphatidylserine/phosphatidylglycerophosphate/cardiolipin synthase-like enzyme